MYNRLRTCISACFYYSGLVGLIRRWTQHSGRYLIVLYYHRAAGGDLRSQWLYLRRHYRILHLEAALEELSMPSKERAEKRDQRTLLALTFDDGYYDNYTHAFALASELQIPITIFLIPGHMESANSFWWADRMIRLAQVGQVTFEGHTYHLDQQGECKALAQIIDACVRDAVSIADREKLLVSICQMLAIPSSLMPKEDPVPLLMWTQVREMEKSGWVSFGAHTIHHPDLEQLTNPVEVQHEIGKCRTMLRQQLGHSVHTFSYPYGHIGYHGLHAVKQAGYKWAVTTSPGFNTSQSDPYLLRRRNANVDRHWLVVAAEVTGIWSSLFRLKSVFVSFVRYINIMRIIQVNSDDRKMGKRR